MLSVSQGTPAIFLPLHKNWIQCSALYQLYSSQALLNIRRTEHNSYILGVETGVKQVRDEPI